MAGFHRDTWATIVGNGSILQTSGYPDAYGLAN
jgi:hypothetical protein